MSPAELEQVQREICGRFGASCVISALDSKLGFALSTTGEPIHGLRHPPAGGTNGWYIYRGEEYSPRANFFQALHVSHLEERCPEALPYLGLPPGYRFLLAGEYVDVWFDASLLKAA